MNHPIILRITAALSATVLAILGATSVLVPIAHAIVPVQRVISPGGIEALLIESRDVGVLSLRFSFKGGILQEPNGKEGVAFLTSLLFDEGAGELTSLELTRQLSSVAANFAAGATVDSIEVQFSTPSSARSDTTQLLKLALSSPRFDAEPLERARREALAELQDETVDPDKRAGLQLAQMNYAGTRLAVPLRGTPESVAGITAADVRAFRARIFARDNLLVAAAGDIDAKELAQLLDDLFAELPAKADLLPVATVRPVPPQHQTIVADRPQTRVYLGNHHPVLTGRHELAAQLFDEILGATSTGRLYVALREREGLVYAVNSHRTGSLLADAYYVSLGAAPENVVRAREIALNEIARLVNDGPTEQELAAAKSALRGRFYLHLDTSPKLSRTVMTMQEDGEPDTYLRDYDAQVASITVEEVREVGRLIAQPDRMVSVTIGRRGAAAAEISNVGRTNE